MKKIYYIFILVLFFFSCKEKEKDYETYFVGYEREFLNTTKEGSNLLRKRFYIAYKDEGLWYQFGRYDVNNYALISVTIEPPGYVKHYYGKWHPTEENTSNYDAIAYQKRVKNNPRLEDVYLNDTERKYQNIKNSTP